VSINLIRKMWPSSGLVISDWSGPEEIDAAERWLKPLLGSVIHQAMHDRMLKIRIGVDSVSGKPFMKYFGPRGDDADRLIWWDMVPPPSQCYPGMLQLCLSLAELDQNLPIRGVLPAIKEGKRVRLELMVNEICSFQIEWKESYTELGR